MSHVLTVVSVDAACSAVEGFSGEAKNFVLRIAKSLLEPIQIDGMSVSGISMALITDRILAKGWLPAGYIDDGDYRLFSYTEI